jgi:hypothetical protein
MRKFFCLFSMLLVLGACASPHTIVLADDSALISVFGNGPEDREKVIQNALAQAGRATAAQGYRYFIILKAQDVSRLGTMTVHDQTGPRTAPNNISKPGTNYVTFSRNVTYLRPGLDITIRMFREGEIDPLIMGVWNIDGTMGPVLDRSSNPKERPRGPSDLRG